MTDKELFDFANHLDSALTPEQREEGLSVYTLGSRERVAEDNYLLAYGVLYARARALALALGYASRNTQFLHNPICLVDEAAGPEAARELMLRHGFEGVVSDTGRFGAKSGHYYIKDGGIRPYAETMWDLYGWRRLNDNAVLAFIGDDRTQEHWVAVAWAPTALVDQGYIPSLL